MIESDKISGLSQQQQLDNSTQDCLDCRLSDMLNTSSNVSLESLGWKINSADDLDYIPAHWLAYKAPEPIVNYILGTIYVFFMLASLTGNGLVIWIFSTAKSMRSTSNIFVINLAVADFFMMSKTPIFIYNSFEGGAFGLGKFWCQVYGVVGGYTGLVQATTNTCIAYDRYKCITGPLDGKVGRRQAITLVALTWMWATPWTLFPLLEIWGRFVPEGYLTSCTFDYLSQTVSNRLFVISIFSFAYLIPMSLIIYFYSRIVGLVVNHEKALKEQAKKMNVESLRRGINTATSAEIRIAKAAIGICLLFVISWTPYAVIALIGAFGDQELLTPTVSMAPALFCKVVACIDPYVYAISHPRYRAELQRRWHWLYIRKRPPVQVHSENASCGSQANDESL